MAFRLELSDLPPRYRAQAERQLARGKKRGDPMQEAAVRRSVPARRLTAEASTSITWAP